MKRINRDLLIVLLLSVAMMVGCMGRTVVVLRSRGATTQEALNYVVWGR